MKPRFNNKGKLPITANNVRVLTRRTRNFDQLAKAFKIKLSNLDMKPESKEEIAIYRNTLRRKIKLAAVLTSLKKKRHIFQHDEGYTCNRKWRSLVPTAMDNQKVDASSVDGKESLQLSPTLV